MKAAADIPAWPLLLTREQLCAYLGGLSWPTLAKVLPVAPLDLGANVLRYSRPEIDAWAASLPPRLPKALQGDGHESQPRASEADAATGDLADQPDTRPSAAVERARKRALGLSGKGRSTWRKSPSSNGSSARTGA